MPVGIDTDAMETALEKHKLKLNKDGNVISNADAIT